MGWRQAESNEPEIPSLRPGWQAEPSADLFSLTVLHPTSSFRDFDDTLTRLRPNWLLSTLSTAVPSRASSWPFIENSSFLTPWPIIQALNIFSGFFSHCQIKHLLELISLIRIHTRVVLTPPYDIDPLPPRGTRRKQTNKDHCDQHQPTALISFYSANSAPIATNRTTITPRKLRDNSQSQRKLPARHRPARAPVAVELHHLRSEPRQPASLFFESV